MHVLDCEKSKLCLTIEFTKYCCYLCHIHTLTVVILCYIWIINSFVYSDGYMSSPERGSRYEDPYYSQYGTRSGSITPVIDEEVR